MWSLLPDIPDLPLRRPATLTAIAPALLSIYAQAVFAMLPNTFILKASLLPFIIWQAWSCTVGLGFSMALTKWLGFDNYELFKSWDVLFTMAMMVMVSKSFEWTFIKKSLRRFELSEGQDVPVECPWSVANILLGASDLLFNQRGIGWSWSSYPFPSKSTPPPSILSILAKASLKFMILDTSQYILYLISSSIDKTGDDTLLDPSLLSILLATFVCGLWAYSQLDLIYHVATLIGRILLRQPAWQWPPFSRRPWMATSIREFWSVRWHQFFRQFFIVCGARPGGALLGQPGAVMGAFAVSGLLHIADPWAAGCGVVSPHDGVFFLLMGVGVILESAFERTTGSCVRGWFGWLWTMAWLLLWGSLLIDSRSRLGIIAVEFFPDHLRPGKMVANGAISLLSKSK